MGLWREFEVKCFKYIIKGKIVTTCWPAEKLEAHRGNERMASYSYNEKGKEHYVYVI